MASILTDRTGLEDIDDDDDGSTIDMNEEKKQQRMKKKASYEEIAMKSPGPSTEDGVGHSITALHSNSSSILSSSKLSRWNTLSLPPEDEQRHADEEEKDDVTVVVENGATLQKRSDEDPEEDEFWTLVMICSILALALVAMITIVLATTDFFQSRQQDLLGATIDERFTVVSEYQSSAKIVLKTGYSSRRPHVEAEVALDHGILKIGRRGTEAIHKTIEQNTLVGAIGQVPQSFYGVLLHSNGSSVFTNEASAPRLIGDEVYARRALIFQDGTSMTTAADTSGGIKHKGDVNFVSERGSIIATTNGQSRMKVTANGTIVFVDPTAFPPKDPAKTGFIFDASNHLMTLGEGAFELGLERNGGSVLKAPMSLHLESNVILLGGAPTEAQTSYRMKCIDQDPRFSRESSKGMSLSLEGQNVFQNDGTGGDVVIVGGTGKQQGGSILIRGGFSENQTSLGTVYINTPQEKDGNPIQATTVIGSEHNQSYIELKGNIVINSPPSSTLGFHIYSSSYFSGDEVSLSPSTDLKMASPKIEIQAEQKLELSSPILSLGSGSQAEHVLLFQNASKMLTQVKGHVIELQSTDRVSIHTAFTEIRGHVQIRTAEGAEIQVAKDTSSMLGSSVMVGDPRTDTVSISGSKITIGPNAKSVIELGQVSTSFMKLDTSQQTLLIHGQELVDVESSKKLLLQGQDIDILGHTNVSVHTEALKLQSKSSIFLSGENVDIQVEQHGQIQTGGSFQMQARDELNFDGKTIHLGTTKTLSEEIHIGSEDSKVFLHGTSIRVNGHDISRRRLLEEDASSCRRTITVIDSKMDDHVLDCRQNRAFISTCFVNFSSTSRFTSWLAPHNQPEHPPHHPFQFQWTSPDFEQNRSKVVQISMTIENVYGVSHSSKPFPSSRFIRCRVHYLNDPRNFLVQGTIVDLPILSPQEHLDIIQDPVQSECMLFPTLSVSKVVHVPTDDDDPASKNLQCSCDLRSSSSSSSSEESLVIHYSTLQLVFDWIA